MIVLELGYDFYIMSCSDFLTLTDIFYNFLIFDDQKMEVIHCTVNYIVAYFFFIVKEPTFSPMFQWQVFGYVFRICPTGK